MSEALPKNLTLHTAHADDPLSSVTILIHTANRPQQLYRLLRYYAAIPSIAACTILVADGSDAANSATFDRLMRTAPFELSYRLQRYSSDLRFPDRLRQALDTVLTPYVMLAADDDFYFVDWISDHIGLFDMRDDVTAVIGNYLVFGLDGFTAFADTISIADGGPERFAVPWLEGDTIAARLTELAANPHGIQTIAWYALHRTKAIRTIFSYSEQYDLPVLLFERFFTVAQAALGKTVFTPDIFLARQSDTNPADFIWRGEPMGLRAQQDGVAKLKMCTTTFLATELACDSTRAAMLSAMVFEPEIAMMRQADGRRWLRLIINRLGLRRWLTRVRRAVPPQARDLRLPQRCDPAELARRGKEVLLACRPDVTG